MSFWLIAAPILLATTAALLWPMLRRSAAPRDPAEFDIEVYRDQLRQIERDYGEGLMDDAAAEAARAEIGRRLLAADARQTADQPGPTPRPDRTVAFAVGFLVPVCALILYADLGTPDLPGFPFSDRAAQTGDRTQELTVLAAQLRKHLEREPADPQAWAMLGRTYIQTGEYDRSVQAYDRALGLDGGNSALIAARAEALVFAAKGIVSPDARQAFEAVLKKEPHDPRAQFYIAIADEQEGRMQAALDRWKALLKTAPPGAAWVAMARDRATRTAAALGLDPAKALPEPAPTGPTEGDAAAAEAMTPDERQAMIGSMVARLAARLKENPNDLEGWLRLGRSYSVLKKDAESRDALARAAALAPGRADVLLLYARAIRAAAGNKQTPESVAVMRKVLDIESENVEALWLVGMAEAAAGDRDAGIAKMQRALDRLPADAPNRDALVKRVEELKNAK